MSLAETTTDHPSAGVSPADIARVALSFLGVLIAGTVFRADVAHEDIPCTANGGCTAVDNSPWSHVTLGPWHDIPVALLGLLAYVALLVLSFSRLAVTSPVRARQLLWLALGISGAGFGYSWYLQYVAHFLIKAFCPWCFASACAMTLFFITAVISAISRRPNPHGSSR